MGTKDTFFSNNFLINCNGSLLDLTTPKVMAILNYTPDSFYDGGKYNNPKELSQRIEQLIEEGADLLDVGCYSSRPGADDIPVEEEKKRLIFVLKRLREIKSDVIVSVDTFRSSIASYVIQEFGVAIINDISAGLLDDQMLKTVGKHNVPYILMHMIGTPQTMHHQTIYQDLTKEMLAFFVERLEAARNANINDIIIDPGFGFSKTVEQSFEILRKLEAFKILERPLLAGLSRKSMIYKTINKTPADALTGTAVVHILALMHGANLLRVHDVKEAVDTIKLFRAYKRDNLQQILV